MLSINNDRRARLAVLFVAAHQTSCGPVLDYYLVMLVVPYLGRIVSLIGSAVLFIYLFIYLLGGGVVVFVVVVVCLFVCLFVCFWFLFFRQESSSCFTSTDTVRLIRDGEPRTATSTFTQLLRVFCREGVLL